VKATARSRRTTEPIGELRGDAGPPLASALSSLRLRAS
jgi:hypothetical protein